MQQPSQVCCHRCDKFRHAANVCRSRSHNHFETKDNFISQTPAHDPCIVDSGVSHHITSNQFPTQCSILQGMDDKTMINGNVIPITHIGTTLLYASNNDFELSTILYAPAIKRKLISVSQFCQDNLTSIQFFPFTFLVKDITIGTPLLCGPSKAGQYEWPLGSLPTIIVVVPSHSLHMWQWRLGHLHSLVWFCILYNFSVSYSSKDKFTYFNSCCFNKDHIFPFYPKTLSSKSPFETLHSYLYCIFVHQYSKCIWLYLNKFFTNYIVCLKNISSPNESNFIAHPDHTLDTHTT